VGYDGAPFDNRETYDMLLWLVSGHQQGALQQWRKSVLIGSTIGFPLHLEPKQIQMLRDHPKNQLSNPGHYSLNHLGGMDFQNLSKLLNSTKYKTLLGKQKNTIDTFIKNIGNTAAIEAWDATVNEATQSAHDALQRHANAQGLLTDKKDYRLEFFTL